MKLIKLEKYMCNYCDQLSLFLDARDEPVKYESYNVEDEPAIASKYGVMSVPVLLLENEEGEVIARVNGFRRGEVEALLEQYEAAK